MNARKKAVPEIGLLRVRKSREGDHKDDRQKASTYHGGRIDALRQSIVKQEVRHRDAACGPGHYLSGSMNKERRNAEQLRIECSDPETQEILADAVERVPGFFTPHGDIPAGDRRLSIGIASLAIGDRDFSRTLMEQLRGESYLLLAAHYLLWSGADSLIRAHLPRITTTLQEVESFAELLDVANALESVGASDLASSARARSESAQRRVLPVWETHDCNMLPAAAAADTVNTFVYAMLGVMPDAPRGRLRVRTCLPDWLQWMSVDNIRMADSIITLRYEEDAKAATYIVEQVSGSIPVRLIFEPTFQHAVGQVYIDGAVAELDTQSVTNRVLKPVQIMLDYERVLRFVKA